MDDLTDDQLRALLYDMGITTIDENFTREDMLQLLDKLQP